MPDETIPRQYRTRPEVVEAVRYQPGLGGNCEVVAQFTGDLDQDDHSTCTRLTSYTFMDRTGYESTVQAGQWVVRAADGECISYFSAEFHRLYEPVEDAACTVPSGAGGEEDE